MKPTDELVNEHNAIVQMLDVLERACAMLDTGIDIDAHDLQKMLKFFQLFADGCHHAKEERFLFPALEQAGIPRDHGPIGVMLAEHDLGRKYIKAMNDAIREPRSAKKSRQFPETFSRNARAYSVLLRAHIEKENRILFPMADVALTAEHQAEVSGQFRSVEGEKTGAESHEALHKLLDELKTAYLSVDAAT